MGEIIKSFVISETEPQTTNTGWVKPTENGYELLFFIKGQWTDKKKEKKAASEAAKPKEKPVDYIGSVQDKPSANTICGAKAFAKDATSALLGSQGDSSTDMTLYGLKAYVDVKLKKSKKG